MDQTQEYDDKLVALLEALWGDGYLSPGGDAETDLVLEGVDLHGARVLDIGSGTGGCAFHIHRRGPASVTGIDVEPGVVEKANAAAADRGVSDTVRFVAVEPGPLPFADGSFDIVFSKDSIVHIDDKHSLAAEIGRVLAPGGIFVCSDWMKGDDLPKSAALLHYEALEGLGFGLASPDVYFAALRAAGFQRIHYTDRTAWLAAKTRDELHELDGPLRDRLTAEVGHEFLEHELEVWRALCVVTDSGELGAGHFRAVKP
ncbi:MAG: class I SAM-dependent methyltransferase [Ilumatobacteraceae bacterium]